MTVNYKNQFESQVTGPTTLGRIRTVVYEWAMGNRPPLDEETSDDMAKEILKAIESKEVS